MAGDMFLKIDGVKGEAQDKKHPGEIDVLSWSWGMSQSGSTHMGGGGGTGKVSVHDMSFTKVVDKSTSVIMEHVCSGKHFPNAVLTVRKAGGDAPVEYLKIKMTEVLVSSYNTGGSGGHDIITENISLNFAKFHVSYTPQKDDGSADAEIEAHWDIAKNAP